MRWEHREYGAISPAVVVALLEESWQIIPFGRWVIRTACRQLRAWKNEGVQNVRMSVNVSPIQLQDAQLLRTVSKALASSRLQPSDLGWN